MKNKVFSLKRFSESFIEYNIANSCVKNKRRLFLCQTDYNHIGGFALNKNWLSLIFFNQCYLKCSGGYVFYN